MNVLSGLPAYWLNFLLHTALLSAFVWCLCLVLRDPGRKAFAAAAGLFFIALLPWITAKGLLPQRGAPVTPTEVSAPMREDDFSGWVVRIDKPARVPELRPAEITTAQGPARSAPRDLRMVLAVLWISGAVIGLFVVVVRHAVLSRRLRSLRNPDEREWNGLSPHATRSRQAFLIAGDEVGPCAAGFLTPHIVLPADLVAEGGGKLRWAVRHEEEHLRSSDPRVAVLLSLVKAILWWNPLVHILGRIWMEERERVCDARALDHPEEGRNYGAFLLELTETGIAAGGLPMAGGGERRLRKRIHALLCGPKVAPRSNASRFGIMGLLAAGAFLACCFGVEEKEPLRVPDTPAKPSVDAGKAVDQDVPIRIIQTRINASYFRTGFAIPESGKVLSNGEKQLMLRRIAQAKGSDLFSPPSIVARNGITKGGFIINTRPVDAEVEDERAIPFEGLSHRMTPVIKGTKVSLSVDCLVNHQPGRLPLEWSWSSEYPHGRLRVPPKDFDWSTIRSATALDTKELSAGESMVVAFKGMQEGVHLTGIFTVVPVDATGREVDSFDHGTAKVKAPQLPPSGGIGEESGGVDDGKRIKLTSKLILSNEAIPEAGKVLKDADVMALLGKLSKDDSTKLRTAPSVMFRSGHRSRVEIIKTSPDARGADESEVDNRKVPFAGLSVESTGTFAGDKIKVSYDALYNHQSGKPDLIFGNFTEEFPEDFDWSRIRSSHAKGEIGLEPGETFVLPFNKVDPGKHLVMMFSATTIDATGRPVNADGTRYSPPVLRLRRDGKMRIRSHIVTLPREGRLPSYWLQIPAFPAEESEVVGAPRTALLYPTRHLADIRKEAVAAGGESAWQDIGDVIAKDSEEVKLGKDHRSTFRAELWNEAECQIRMNLPGEQGKFAVTGYLGQILGVELKPTETANRRVFLLALDDAK
ncbi:M56 family metallopeptidase [Luteolibacter sp. SL250]|uniref:M56 family metallopeptidase n=1 Tax=Luteolibacter sp. SL250 TaxID=2995170 RepID=UPI0022716700|nr:M56 family metallopeptidase [Luteolibacter sp. SL250]WAC20202.1 M56 family metallopeptidase [Luteolibacter sp. SL250]